MLREEYEKSLNYVVNGEQQSCEDKGITREEAISVLYGIKADNLNLDDAYTKDKYEALDMAIKALEQEPKTGHWILVSERLPEDQEVILVSTKTDRVFEGRYYDDNTKCQWYSFRDDTFAWNNVVTAWMPLPEPYKAEREE